MEEAKVSLNKIYTHGSYRFYQASYDEDEMGSVLAINSDPFGIPVTYCGYFLLFVSLIWILLDTRVDTGSCSSVHISSSEIF